MPWNAPSPAPKCPYCGKPVFPAEAYMAADRRPYHKQCVKCWTCGKKLVPATINNHEGKLYCPACYANKFMPQVGLTVLYGLPHRILQGSHFWWLQV